MKRTIVGCAGLLSLLLVASPAAAATCSQGSPTARVLTFDTANEDTLTGFSSALRFGLDPATFPADEIAKNSRTCIRGTFQVRGLTFTLFGNDDSLPIRWAEVSGSPPGLVLYLASLPKPAAAFDWEKHSQAGETGATFKLEDMMVVLALTADEKRYLHLFFDVIPDDTTLAKTMCAALAGQLPPAGVYDTSDGTSEMGTPRSPPDVSALPACGWTPATPH